MVPAAAIAVIAPRGLRFAATLIAVGLAGWLLPANQLARSDFTLPASNLQTFEVISTAQPWGAQHRFWISLSESANRVGYLELERNQSLKLGASYLGQLRIREIEGLDRASYSARLIGEPELIGQPSYWQQLIGDSRENFQQRVRGLSPDAIGLVLGLTVGDRSKISETLLVAMRELSLTHIVAVSGANLAIAMGASYLLARAVGAGRRGRFLAASATALGYAAVVGPEPSVLRALFMAHVVLLCLYLGRRTAALVAIGWAALILLAIDPYLAEDFGFALSVAATSGILLLSGAIQQRLELRMPRPIALALGVSVAAQLFTLPILLMLQPGIPSYSVLANLLVMPLLTPITLLGLLSFVLQPLRNATELLSSLASWAAWCIEALALVLIDWPMTRLPWPEEPLGPALAALIATFCTIALLVRKSSRASVSVAILLTAMGLIASIPEELNDAMPANWLAIVCDVGQGDALLVKSDQAIALIDVGPRPDLIERCLVRAGVTDIDLLVITHFDLDHVGGLQAVLDCCTVGAVMLPAFEDRRGIQDRVESQLATQRDLKVLSASSGLAGRLGSAAWQVLAPGVIESAGEDSNAASIVLLIETAEYRLVALGDVPASVQDRIGHHYGAKLSSGVALPTVLKVSHHGAADQSARFTNLLQPDFAIFSVGRNNNYGHPTAAALEIALSAGARIVRTDLMGSSVLHHSAGELRFD